MEYLHKICYKYKIVPNHTMSANQYFTTKTPTLVSQSLIFAKLSPSASPNLAGLTSIIISVYFLTPHPAHPGQV